MPKGRVTTCLFCEKTFATRNLSDHVRVHTFEKPYFCNSCGRGFSQRGYQKTHQLIHSGHKPFKCDIGHCKKRFAESANLTKHKRVHFDIRKYECKFCDQSFKWRSSLTSHLKSKHLFDNWDKCPLCTEKFETIPKLHSHLRAHKSLGRSECPLCGKIFSTFADQQDHLLIEHKNQVKMLQCPFCTKNFQNSSNLTRHIRSHIHERYFVCPHPHCDKSFVQSSRRQSHISRCHQS